MGAKTFNAMQGIAKTHRLAVMKSDDDQRLVFGWASVAVRVTGETIEDYQQDVIEIAELEQAAYDYVGIPDGYMPEGWWVGFRIDEDSVWQKVKEGTYSMFSIEGTATRQQT
jgi:hypothetical protein